MLSDIPVSRIRNYIFKHLPRFENVQMKEASLSSCEPANHSGGRVPTQRNNGTCTASAHTHGSQCIMYSIGSICIHIMSQLFDRGGRCTGTHGRTRSLAWTGAATLALPRRHYPGGLMLQAYGSASPFCACCYHSSQNSTPTTPYSVLFVMGS